MKTQLLLIAMFGVCMALPFKISLSRKKRDTTGTQACGGVLTDPQGVITSPNFPSEYPNNANCVWRINTNSPVEISFTNFDIEGYMYNCGFDKLLIIDGDNTLELCGQMLPTPILTSHNTVKIIFITDGSVTRTGFRLEYEQAKNPASKPITTTKPTTTRTTTTTTRTTTTTTPPTTTRTTTTTPTTTTTTPTTTTTTPTTTTTTIWTTPALVTYSDCGGLLTNPSGVITSPNFPNNYPNNAHCVWTINTTSRIKISFTNFDLEGYMYNCFFDMLQLDDGVTTYELCGQMLPMPIISSHNTMQIVFISDFSLSRTGFRLQYTPV